MKKFHLLIPILVVSVSIHSQTFKKPISGLVSMGNVNKVIHGGKTNSLAEVLAHPKLYNGIVVMASWKMLEPQEGKYDYTVLDEALEQVEKYNVRYPKNTLAVKFRIFSGFNAPEWVLRLGNGPMLIYHSVYTKGKKKKAPIFWSLEYRNAWRKLQEILAERYDGHELVREVAISSCATMSAEPFIQPLGKQENIEEYQKFGYSDQIFKDALLAAFEDYSFWEKTCLDYTVNPFPSTDKGVRIYDTDFSIELLKKFRERYGERAIIANHGLQPNLFERVLPIYAAMKELGPPISFQTFSPKTLTIEALNIGIRTGVSQLEVWESKAAGATGVFSKEDLQLWKALLRGD